MTVIRYIPNLLTLANLLSGCVGIVAVAEGNVELGSYFIWLAALFDFFDGLTARAFNAYSSIGGELDSLSDMVSFGVLPSFIMYMLLHAALPASLSWLSYVAFLIAACSAVRLAIFNVDTRQTHNFVGLPTPASALLISALPLSGTSFMAELLDIPTFLIVLILLDAYMMVARVELMAFKFKSFAWSENKLKYLFMLTSLVLIFALNILAIPIIIILYVVLSIVRKSLVKSGSES